jgi:hypothetical protein
MPTPTPQARQDFLNEIYAAGLRWSGPLHEALLGCNDDAGWTFVEQSGDYDDYVHFLTAEGVENLVAEDEIILVNSAAQFIRYLKQPKP